MHTQLECSNALTVECGMLCAVHAFDICVSNTSVVRINLRIFFSICCCFVLCQMENLDDIIAAWPTRSFKPLDLNTVEVLNCEILVAKASHTKYLHAIDEKQLYTAHDFSKFGKVYRCRHRTKCSARITVLPSGQVVRLPDAKQHSHTTDESQEIKNLRALNAMKKKCRDLRAVAGGRRMTKVKDIFTEVMIE